MLIEVITSEPWPAVSVDDVKMSQRIMHSLEDPLIDRAIRAATRYLARTYQISIVASTVRVSLPAWPQELELPSPPLRYSGAPSNAVRIGRLVDGAVVDSPGLYAVGHRDQVWTISRISNVMPAIDETPFSFRVECDVGYETAAVIPEDIQSAIILLAGHLYQNREAVVIEPRVITVPRSLELGVEALMKHYRVQTRYVNAWSA